MNFLIPLVCLVVIIGLLGILAYLIILLKVINQLTKVNEQLLIVVAGKEPKPESALRALVASAKPPQGKLKGIADGKKDNKKPTNTDYSIEVGVH